MSDGFISWYQGEWSPGAARGLVSGLADRGWESANPLSGNITAINNDGDQVVITGGEMLDMMSLVASDSALLQWWLDDSTDLTHSIRRLPDGTVAHELDLDGADEYFGRIVQAVIPLVVNTSPSAYGVIVDRYGGSQEVPWDAIVAGGDIPIDVMPDLLALPRDVDARHPEVGSYEPIRTIGDLVIHDPGGILPALEG